MADGMPIDASTIQRILQAKGGANTPDNIMRIKEFAGANPDVLERYSMGGGRSNQDNSDLLNLDKQMAAIDGKPQIQSSELPPLPTVQASTQPNRRTATAGTPQGNWANASENPNLGGVPARNASPGEASAAAGSGNSWWDLLAPILLGGAALSQMRNPNSQSSTPESRMQGRVEDYRANNPQITNANANQKRISYDPTVRQLPDESGPKMPSGAPEIPKGAPQKVGAAMQDPAEVARMQAEVDAENKSSQNLMDQMAAREADQVRTHKLAEAARRATGRR